MTTPRVQSEYRIEPDRAPVLIALQGVCKIYGQGPQEVHALKQVSLAVPAGEFVVILGPSGSGKTTLLNLLGGLDTPSMGTATVDGVELAALSPPALTQYRREHVGFIFQFYNLIPTLTAQENVELAARLVARPHDPLETLAQVGLAERAHRFPGQLSGGEQQRVAVARALVKNPRLILADEPTGNLDSATAMQVLEVMRQACTEDRRTFLVVTHNTAIARMADRVVRLRDGRVVENVVNPTPADPRELEW